MGNNLVVSYDLSQPNRDYHSLINEIKALGNWAHVHGSMWYVKSALSAASARDQLQKVLDRDDSLLVVDATNNDAAWYNLKPDVAAFLKEWWHRKLAA